MYYFYLTTIKKVYAHPNADRIQLCEVLGSQCVVGLDAKEGDKVLFFPVDGCVSKEFAETNKLTRPLGGYLEQNLRIRAQKFRGAISEGLVCPISYLEKIVGKETTDSLDVGFRGDVVNNIRICEKYYAKATRQNMTENSKKIKVRRETIYFRKHIDTENIKYFPHKFKNGDFLVITQKSHGSSGRTAHVLHNIELPKWKQLVNRLYNIFPNQTYQTISGSRNVILTEDNKVVNNDLRKKINEYFDGKLNKNEILYYEIVGFDGPVPIMPSHDTTKLKDKEFTTKYGSKMIYNYGCREGEFKVLLYRVVYVNPEGIQIDLPWDDVVKRADELGVKTPVELDRFIYNGDPEELLEKVRVLGDGPDPMGNHYLEGCCVRRNHTSKFETYKHKNFNFLVMEDLAKADDQYVDTEEIS